MTWKRPDSVFLDMHIPSVKRWRDAQQEAFEEEGFLFNFIVIEVSTVEDTNLLLDLAYTHITWFDFNLTWTVAMCAGEIQIVLAQAAV